MAGIEAAWGALQLLALDRTECLLKALVAHDLLPGRRFGGNRAADLQEGVGIGHPEARADEHLLRRKMDVETRGVHVAPQTVAELARAMLLVRTFVLREAHVAVDAEHRAAMGPR